LPLGGIHHVHLHGGGHKGMRKTQYEVLWDYLFKLEGKLNLIISDLKIMNQKMYAIEDKVGYRGLQKLSKRYTKVEKK
jgi:hypothetical protein